MPWFFWDLITIIALIGALVSIIVLYQKTLLIISIPTIIILIIGIYLLIYGSYIEPHKLITKEYDINLSKNKFQRKSIKIAFLADLHLGPYKGKQWVKKVVNKIRETQPDLILIAGDFIYNDKGIPKLYALKEFNIFKVPIYAVVGNHEYNVSLKWKRKADIKRANKVKEIIKKTNIKLLDNEPVLLSINKQTFWLIGTDSWLANKADLKMALEKTIDNYPKILLSHNPDIIMDIKKEYNISLVLSGHTHGGQIRLPFIGPLASIPTYLGRKYDKGLFEIKNTKLFITTGVSESGPRARLFMPPEISIIKLTL